MARGGQRKQSTLERHDQVFDRKLNGFRRGNAQQLPPPPEEEEKLPRKLRTVMALQAGLPRSAAWRPLPPPQAKPVAAAAPPVAPRRGDALPAPRERAAGLAAPPAASNGVSKRKPKERAKSRRKRLRQESIAEAACPPDDAPRFGEVAHAPPAVALARKQSLGHLFQRQLQGAAAAAQQNESKESRQRDATRLDVIAQYRKMRGHEALPYAAALQHTLQ